VSDPIGGIVVLLCMVGGCLVIVTARGQIKADRERRRVARVFELVDLRLNKIEATMNALPNLIAEALRRHQEKD
jgi:hypothetical protein